MRISTPMIHYFNTGYMLNAQSELVSTNNQITTGKRVNSAADDPVGIIAIDNFKQYQTELSQYQTNLGYAQNRLSVTENALGAAQSLVINAKESMLSANNGARSDIDKQAIAKDLLSLREALLDIANTRDEGGNYLFSGSQTEQPAFVDIGDGTIQYQGDNVVRAVLASQNIKIETNVSGIDAFGIPENGATDPFQNLQRAAEMLNQPAALDSVAEQTEYAQLLEDMDRALEQLNGARSEVGNNLKRIEYFIPAHEQTIINAAQAQANLEDIDIAEAISVLSQQQVAYEAAMASYARISSANLFSYI